jgi:hypothetical protein
LCVPGLLSLLPRWQKGVKFAFTKSATCVNMELLKVQVSFRALDSQIGSAKSLNELPGDNERPDPRY